MAARLLQGPGVLFVDEPFEAIDPMSARTLRHVLERHTSAGGTVVFSSHVMELVERLCDHVAVVNRGALVASGELDQVRGEGTLEDAFVRFVGGERSAKEGLEWLGSSSD